MTFTVESTSVADGEPIPERFAVATRPSTRNVWNECGVFVLKIRPR